MAVELESLASKLYAGASSFSIGGVNFSLPTLGISVPSAEPGSIGAYLGTQGSIVQTLTAGARGVLCTIDVLTDPAKMWNVLKSCMAFLGATALSFINDVYKVCMARLNDILATYYGIVNSYFNAIKAVLNAWNSLVDLYEKFIDWWKNRRSEMWDNFLDRTNCDMEIASFLKCMIYKLLEPYLEKAKNAAYKAINETADSIQSTMTDTTKGSVAMAQYVERQGFFVTKMSQQLGSYL